MMIQQMMNNHLFFLSIMKKLLLIGLLIFTGCTSYKTLELNMFCRHNYEIKEYNLTTYKERCIYCGKENIKFYIKHSARK